MKGTKVNISRIDEILKEERLTHAAVARLCGISAQWRLNMERNGATSPATLDKLALVLRVPREELLAKEEPKAEPKEEPKTDMTALEKKLEILSAEAWLFAKLKHNRDGISESNLKVLAQNNGIAQEELDAAMDTIGADRYKKNGNTWLSLYRSV